MHWTQEQKKLVGYFPGKGSNTQNLNTDFLQGLDQNIQKVKSGEVSFIKAGKYKVLEPSFLLTDLSHLKILNLDMIGWIVGFTYF
ncbi:MAG: hypothetical protein R2769_10775 [Saprospiraceae bacterium]